MSYFKAKMHQILFFGWASTPDPARGAYSTAPDTLAGFDGSYFQGKGREREDREREGRRMEREGRG